MSPLDLYIYKQAVLLVSGTVVLMIEAKGSGKNAFIYEVRWNVDFMFLSLYNIYNETSRDCFLKMN